MAGRTTDYDEYVPPLAEYADLPRTTRAASECANGWSTGSCRWRATSPGASPGAASPPTTSSRSPRWGSCTPSSASTRAGSATSSPTPSRRSWVRSGGTSATRPGRCARRAASRTATSPSAVGDRVDVAATRAGPDGRRARRAPRHDPGRGRRGDLRPRLVPAGVAGRVPRLRGRLGPRRHPRGRRRRASTGSRSGRWSGPWSRPARARAHDAGPAVRARETQAEIAAVLCISQMHVSRLLSRTLAALRDQIERETARGAARRRLTPRAAGHLRPMATTPLPARELLRVARPGARRGARHLPGPARRPPGRRRGRGRRDHGPDHGGPAARGRGCRSRCSRPAGSARSRSATPPRRCRCCRARVPRRSTTGTPGRPSTPTSRRTRRASTGCSTAPGRADCDLERRRRRHVRDLRALVRRRRDRPARGRGAAPRRVPRAARDRGRPAVRGLGGRDARGPGAVRPHALPRRPRPGARTRAGTWCTSTRGCAASRSSARRGCAPSTVTVRAERVVLATGVPILDRGLYFARVEPSRSYAQAVRVDGPLPPACTCRPTRRGCRCAPR